VRSSATPEEFGTFIAQEQAKMRRLAASGGLKPE